MWTRFGQGFDSPHFHQFGELTAEKRFLYVYLEILNISVNNSTRENPIPYLKQFPYGTASSYHLQHVMSLSEICDYKNFEREARLLFDKKTSPISRYLLRQVVNHSLNNTLDIDFQAVQRLENFYFPYETNNFYKSNSFHKRLVLNQAKIKRKIKSNNTIDYKW